MTFFRQNRPGNARQCVGQGHGGDVRAAPFLNAQCPAPHGVRIDFSGGVAQHAARAMDEQGAQVGVAALADAVLALFAAA